LGTSDRTCAHPTPSRASTTGDVWSDIGRIVKRYEKYGRNPSWIVKRYGKYRRKVSWIVKRYGNYGRKVSW
jgi:hypothetical protein